MKTKIDLEPKDIQLIHDIIHDWMGLDFTEEQIIALMKKERDILLEIAEFGVFDTCVRESLMSSIAMRLTGRKMPTYGDGEEAGKQFFKELGEKAKAAGIKVV
jgi:hypothetical protein